MAARRPAPPNFGLDQDTPITRATMETVVVKKDLLLATLTTNRDAHRAVFEEALAGYKKRVLELIDEHVERINKGKVEQVFINIPMPSDHTDDYDRVIASMEWTIFDEVELTMHEFDMYVRDSWNWKQEWTTSNSVYAASLQQH